VRPQLSAALLAGGGMNRASSRRSDRTGGTAVRPAGQVPGGLRDHKNIGLNPGETRLFDPNDRSTWWTRAWSDQRTALTKKKRPRPKGLKSR
jgi:hypothetical protein